MSFRDVQDRFRAILEGRGADGSMGAAAAARAIPPDTFRVTENPTPETADGAAIDRAVNLALRDVEDLIPRNVHCNERSVRAVLEVRVSYVAAPALVGAVYGELTPTAAQSAASDWGPRALDDARLIERALTWYELTGNDTQPVIERCAPLGPVILNDLGNGRGYALRRFELFLEDSQP